ncbi:MAG: CPBP family glutamic-type intramembrane protease, partial [Promethearchaeota archaeon]
MSLDLEYLNKKNPIGKVFLFFIITILWSWIFWIPSVLPYFGVTVPGWLTYTSFLALFGPSIIGVVMTAIESKHDAKKLLKSSFDFKFKKIWLLPVFLVPMGFAAIATILIVLIEGLDPFAYGTSWAMLVPVLLIILFVGGPIAEEFGWRGYALDRLQVKFNATVSSLILG